MAEFEVEFYETTDGDKPAKDFLISLDNKMRAKMASMISLLQENGYNLREPYSKHLSEGIFELRAKVGSDITRVMYFFYIDRRVILTNGFVKKTKKTPLKELEKAKKYRQDYLRRKGVDDGRKV
ncbi:MAG: type II toxin-antitoxin system RelE/ParE family toxin [Lachnospiraceae bacterium]|jgi:phage-related protein|nr:type II toxin-antitoxin system RelE/ParE family toxin [Lachnospiraceae bacterium]